MDQQVDYRPGAFYYRRALRTARGRDEAVVVGLELVSEHERLKAWVRQQGLIPPKFTVLREEALDKGWQALG